jgi:digeranylgeranylglycerophospholipid reductase
MYDVIVVGGGPIGSYTAGWLADKGYKVVVLEKKPRAGESVCCTGIVGMECVNIFKIADSLILRKVNSASLFPPSGKPLFVQREEPQACILDRAAFDVAMAERAQAAGAEYFIKSRVTDISVTREDVTVNVAGKGKYTEIQSKAVVIAAGFAPSLLQKLGLGTYGDFTVGAQVEVETCGIDSVEVYFGETAPGFFAWIAPTTPPSARIGLLTRKTPGIYLRKWLKQLENEGKIKTQAGELSYGAIPLKPPPRTYGERLIAVGDAAGQVKPTSGGGIYYGLLSADIAAATLHGALEDNDLSADRLARYQRGWKKKLGRELTVGYWARRIFERLSEKQIDRIFEIVRSGNIDEAMLKAKDLSFDWHSKTILRLLRYQMVARTLNILRIPLRSSRVDG